MKDERVKKDEYQKALAAYSEAMKDFRKGRFEKAAEELKTFIEKHPAEREFVERSRMYLAICSERLKEKKDLPVLKTFDDCCHFGVYKMNTGDYEEAFKLLEKAVKLEPESGLVHYLLANLHILMNKPEESLEALKKAIQIDKSYKILAQNENDFEPLWEDKKFRILTRLA